MLSSMFNVFETTEAQLTPSAIKRLRVTSILGAFAMPCFAAYDLLDVSGPAGYLLLGAGGLSFAALVYFSCARMANRLWVPEKYLDEAEIDRKRRSGSLAYQLMLGILTVVLAAAVIISDGNLEARWNPRVVVYGLAITFAGILSFQTAIAAYMTEPLSEGPVEKVAADRRYKWIVLGILIVIVGLGYATGALFG